MAINSQWARFSKKAKQYEKLHHQILVALPRAFCSSNIFHCHHIIVLDGNGLGNFNTPDIHGIDNVMDIPAHIQKVVEISVFIHNGSANGSLFHLPIIPWNITRIQPRTRQLWQRAPYSNLAGL